MGAVHDFAGKFLTGEIRAFKPGLIVFIDAADMGEAPGTVRWIAMDKNKKGDSPLLV